MGLTADDEEGREGRDAAESHLEWWCCWYSVGGVFRCRRRQCWLVVSSKQRQKLECMFMSWAEDGSKIGRWCEGGKLFRCKHLMRRPIVWCR
jgi:hypothetical protein